MKLLKSIMFVYLFGIVIFLLFILFSLPFFLSERFNNDNYLFLFLIIAPVFIGIMFYLYDKEYESERPKR